MAYPLSRKEQWIAETEDKVCCPVQKSEKNPEELQ